MKRCARTLATTTGLVCLWLVAAGAEAATPRAYVSVNGNDANVCNVPATPCRTYTGAISQVTPGGEVIVLDSGTFGGGTISQAVTINAPAGIVALSATSLIVDPGSGNAVVLRGLTLQAPSLGIGTAITHQSGLLFVENSVVDGWFFGLSSANTAERLFVKGSVFRNQSYDGLRVEVGSTAVVAIEDSFFVANFQSGLRLDGGAGRVSNTTLTASAGYGAVVGGATTEFTFQRCEASSNSIVGLFGVNSATLHVSQSTMTRNGTGLGMSSGAVVESFGNNVIRGNAAATLGTITPVTLQ